MITNNMYLAKEREKCRDDGDFFRQFKTRYQWAKQWRLCKDNANYYLGTELNGILSLYCGKAPFVGTWYYVQEKDTIPAKAHDLKEWLALQSAVFNIREYERAELSISNGLRVAENEFECESVYCSYDNEDRIFDDKYIEAIETACLLTQKLLPNGNPNKPLIGDYSLWTTPEH